jgi:hypothetical protein
MGRLRFPAALGASIVGVILGAVMACGTGGDAEGPVDPTLAPIDFRSVLVIEVGDEAVRTTAGERVDPAVRTDPPTVPSGAVIEVVNAADGQQRLRGGDTFDTGILLPGERTTVVAVNDGDQPLSVPIIEVLSESSRGQVTILAPAG